MYLFASCPVFFEKGKSLRGMLQRNRSSLPDSVTVSTASRPM